MPTYIFIFINNLSDVFGTLKQMFSALDKVMTVDLIRTGAIIVVHYSICIDMHDDLSNDPLSDRIN